MRVKAFKTTTSDPADLSGLETLLQTGAIQSSEVACIIGKTEGNGGRNDFTRDLAMMAFEELFAESLQLSRKEITDRIIFSLSGGCEGVVSPHIVVFTRSGSFSDKPFAEKRLALGTGFTREFTPSEIGRMPQVEETARVIKEIIEENKIEPGDLRFVQMKGAIPAFTYEQELTARQEGRPLRSDMVYSRGASALGAAVAIGEVDIAEFDDDAICSDWSLYSSTASCSAKPGLKRTEIMVMGNSFYWQSNLVIENGVLQNMIDAESVRGVLRKLGFEVAGSLKREETERLVGIFAKSEADPRGTIAGKRHTMLTDDDISDTRYSRCVLGAVLASVTGDTAVYISTRSEHHGPSGGGTVAIISRV
ncbi:MAG: ring-opening amidohydrolase [Candidatus Obscuribacterales bacterium]|nr:ring-opening amidohydrolase [Candidatus Obscuribacterales bacterium]